MPNIHVTFSETEAIGFQFVPVRASAEVQNGLTKPADVQTSLGSTASSDGEIELTVTTTRRGRRTYLVETHQKMYPSVVLLCVTGITYSTYYTKYSY
jgi:hypothetical protein